MAACKLLKDKKTWGFKTSLRNTFNHLIEIHSIICVSVSLLYATCSLQVCARQSSVEVPDTAPPSRAARWPEPSPRSGRCLASGSKARPQWFAHLDAADTVEPGSAARFWTWLTTAAWHPGTRQGRQGKLSLVPSIHKSLSFRKINVNI